MPDRSKIPEIIPLDLDVMNDRERAKLRGIIREELEEFSREQRLVFALRNALRTAWVLEKLTIKDKERVREFYAIWLRRITVATLYAIIPTRKITAAYDADAYDAAYDAYAAAADAAYAADADAAYAAYAAYAADTAYAYAISPHLLKNHDYLRQLNSDLSLLKENHDLLTSNLWLDQFNLSLPNLPHLDNDFWNKHLFGPALKGTLAESSDFFESFQKIDEVIFDKKSPQAMQAFIESNMAGATRALKNARLILLGNGGAGKTSLVNKLFMDKLTHNEKPTPRVQVRDFPIEFEGNKEKLSVWDFGGQVIMHSTHSFFLSKESTYLIACNTRANEQPDEWLRFLTTRVDKNKRLSLLIVYTHCDQKYSTVEGSPWYRGNSIRREFGKQFDFTFHNIDLYCDKQPAIDDFAAIKKTIEERACIEFDRQMMPNIAAIKEKVEAMEGQQQPFINHADLVADLKLNNTSTNWLEELLDANKYGFIFPEKPLHVTDKDDDDFVWVSQKHWLTYGVYQLINNSEVITARGLLSNSTIKSALATRYIEGKTGKIYKTKIKAEHEVLKYDKQGIAVLKRILENYRWAFITDKRHDELLLPLATSLDEPTALRKLANKMEQFKNNKNPPIIMEVVLVNKPSDFFFKLMTYLNSHLPNPNNLWRTGAILDFYGYSDTQAIIEMPASTLSLKIMGDDQDSFQQLLLISIKEALKFSGHQVEAYLSERVDLGDGKFEMLRTDVLNHLISGSDRLQGLKDQAMKRVVNMSTYNIYGGATGSNIGGERNTLKNEGGIYIDTAASDLAKTLRTIAEKLSGAEQQLVVDAATELESVIDETDESKKVALAEKIIKTGKLASAVDKLADLGGEYYDKLGYVYTNFGELVKGGVDFFK